MSDTLKPKIAQLVRERSSNAVARALGVPRTSVLSFIAGTAREGTALLIATRAERLDALTARGPSAA